MAKDPAFLFYPNDYLGGTMGMTFEEKGAYMELLMAQFNRGHMKSNMCVQIVGPQLWDAVKHKFIEDEGGLFYNARLEEEKTKRQKFTQTRRNNLSGNNQYTKKAHMGGHMTTHMENVNEDDNVNKKENDIKNKIPITECKDLTLTDDQWVRINNTNGQELDRFNEYLQKQGIYELNPAEYKRYFHHLKEKKPDKVKQKLTIEDYRRMALEADQRDARAKKGIYP